MLLPKLIKLLVIEAKMCIRENLYLVTGWVRLIRSHSSARFCFELSANSNYNIFLFLYPLIFDQVINILGNKLRIKCKIRINCVRINQTRPVVYVFSTSLCSYQLKYIIHPNSFDITNYITQKSRQQAITQNGECGVMNQGGTNCEKSTFFYDIVEIYS